MKYRRVPHQVRVELLAEAWIWLTPNHESVAASAGDYRVTDRTGGSMWSVTPQALAEGYCHIHDEVYESRGTVDAVPANSVSERSTLLTTEGPETPSSGDWILTDATGNQWVVDAAFFEKNYRRA